ncbi:hypothetical protein G5B46_04690 [Caulobacter sp. 602-2]|uniref:Uncharacterized protein n=1 Tax=Caulobacter sp. 602-2 TaxID=2710887 RepID=A0A6G4QTC0_9CAUL|nr:hypothetical protein [Caulobacter sp. 602-2]NGM48896.1 hypothetical protein [Caulobacter sp. 602-2]
MPKSKPPRRRLRRTAHSPKIEAAYRGMIAACDQNIALIQRTISDVERVAHDAPPEEVQSFRQEMEEGVRCWTSIRNMHLDYLSRPPRTQLARHRAGPEEGRDHQAGALGR